jgi:hypothetical protein
MLLNVISILLFLVAPILPSPEPPKVRRVEVMANYPAMFALRMAELVLYMRSLSRRVRWIAMSLS